MSDSEIMVKINIFIRVARGREATKPDVWLTSVRDLLYNIFVQIRQMLDL